MALRPGRLYQDGRTIGKDEHGRPAIVATRLGKEVGKEPSPPATTAPSAAAAPEPAPQAATPEKKD